MKKFLVLALSLLLVLALAATAMAGIRNTLHDFQSGVVGGQGGFESGTDARGMCSYCHIPHSSKGDRLWPTTGDSASLARAGVVGILCASCHNLTVGNTANSNSPFGSSTDGVLRSMDVYDTADINHVLVDDGVYANNTNQNYSASLTAIPAAYPTASAQFGQANVWPYATVQGLGTTAQNIECSSCHNPHSEEYGQSTITAETNGRLRMGNDFLRASFYNTANGIAFCEYCHEEKTRGGRALNTIGTGTHPVGTTANADRPAQADIHIESGERAPLGMVAAGVQIVSDVQYDMGIGTGIWPLVPGADNGIGTHLTSYSTGGVTCQTCHKVHGAPKGVQNSWYRGGNTKGSYVISTGEVAYLGASDDGNCNILAVENDANGGTVGYAYPTEGRTDGDYNDLCIDCHETTPSVGPNWLASNDSATNTAADAGSNANYITDAHPVNIAPDGTSESGFDLTVKDPGWTGTNSAARWAGEAGTPASMALVANGRWTGSGVPSNGRSEIICMTCHSLHDGEKGTPILRANSATYCIDCHSPSIGAVSHPVGTGSSMYDNPDGVNWPNGDSLPLSDYYQGTGGSSFNHSVSVSVDMECFTCHAAHDGVDGFMLRVTDNNSRICTGCHTDAGNGGSENPANYIAEYGEAASVRLGSHYTGTVSNSDATIGEVRWTFSGSWSDTTSATKQTSHWYGSDAAGTTDIDSVPPRTGLRMQCQSCHTPHDAATGLVEANAYDGSITNLDLDHTADAEDIDVNYNGTTATRMAYTPTTALLLGNNAQSKMCATCHWPVGTHVTTIYTVPAKPDPVRAAGGEKKKYRNYCTRTSAFIIELLNGEQEYQYNVYDLIADGNVTGTGFDGVRTPESPCNFPPLQRGQYNSNATTAMPGSIPSETGEMLCDSCHAPHAAATGSGAFILEAGTGDASTLALANQRIATRNYQDLCWLCHDK